MNRLDRFASRHPILASVAVLAIIAICLDYAYQLDQQESSLLRWQIASRSTT